MVIELDDTGPGMPAFKYDSDSPGIGLRNTIDRLHGFYGDSYSFNIKDKSSNGISVCMIKLPLEKKRGNLWKARLLIVKQDEKVYMKCLS